MSHALDNTMQEQPRAVDLLVQAGQKVLHNDTPWQAIASPHVASDQHATSLSHFGGLLRAYCAVSLRLSQTRCAPGPYSQSAINSQHGRIWSDCS